MACSYPPDFWLQGAFLCMCSVSLILYSERVFASLSPCQSFSWETLGWRKHKLESRLPGEISITSDMQMIPPLWQKVKNKGASWWKWKRRGEKSAWSSAFRKTKIMASGPITSWQIDGETVADYLRGGASKITADGDCSHEIKRRLLLGRKVMTNLESILKSRDITLSTKVRLVKAMVFPGVMWELDCEESWAPKNWCFWTVVLEKTLENPLDCKEIEPVHPKGNESWIVIGRTDAEAETPILWPPDAKSWLIWKDPGAGRDWGQEKGTTEDEMVGWHHRLSGHGFGWTPGVGDGQGGVACGVLGSQGVGHDWGTELNWTVLAMIIPWRCLQETKTGCLPYFCYFLFLEPTGDWLYSPQLEPTYLLHQETQRRDWLNVNFQPGAHQSPTSNLLLQCGGKLRSQPTLPPWLLSSPFLIWGWGKATVLLLLSLLQHSIL